MKKTLAMLLALMMLLACIPAMAEDVENPYAEYGVEIKIDPATGKPYDLGGMVVTVVDWWSSDWHDEDPATTAEEDTKAYREWIEETYNFTINRVSATGWPGDADFATVAQSGTEENYVWTIYAGKWASAMNSGLMYDLSTLDCLDFTAEKWNTTTMALGTKSIITKDGEEKTAIFAMRPEATEPRKGIFFNKRLLNEAGVDPESIYDMQANGTWTWAAFEELCAKLTRDTDNDGVIDRYAMMNFSSDLLPGALVSNGVGFVMVDENGKFYNAAETDAFLTAANWVEDMVKKYEMPTPEGAEWNYYKTAFKNAEVALQCNEDYFAGELSDMDDDYGFVMFPKPNEETATYMWAPTDNIYCIPACYDHDTAWKIAFAFNLFTETTPGYDDPEAWKADYYKKYRDDRAVDETIAMMRGADTQFIWYADMVPGYDLGSQYLWSVYGLNPSATPIEKAEEMRATWQAYLDDANAVIDLTKATETAE